MVRWRTTFLGGSRSWGAHMVANLRRPVAILAVTCALLIAVGTPAASAQAPSSSATAAAMTLNCLKMSSKTHAYAVSHGYCGSRATAGVTPDNSVAGDCGTADLYIWDDGGGYAGMYLGVYSTDGAVMLLSYAVDWQNWDYGEMGEISDNVWPWDAAWSTTTDAYTGGGYVTAVMGGTATLVWGGECDILNPTDGTNVTS